MNQIYGFEGEVKAKYTAQMYELFSEVFEWLPLAQCINGKVLVRAAAGTPLAPSPTHYPSGPHVGRCAGEVSWGWGVDVFGASPHSCPHPEPQIMHGGLFSEDGVTLDDIRKIERNRQPPDSGDRVGWVTATPSWGLGVSSRGAAWAQI